MKFRKKPVIIGAVQFLDRNNDGGNSDEVAEFLGDNLSGFSDTEVHYKNTPHGTILSTNLGEWIIKGNYEFFQHGFGDGTNVLTIAVIVEKITESLYTLQVSYSGLLCPVLGFQ